MEGKIFRMLCTGARFSLEISECSARAILNEGVDESYTKAISERSALLHRESCSGRSTPDLFGIDLV